MEGVIVKKTFESSSGAEIEKGEFWLDEEATKQSDDKYRIYQKAGYDETIKLTNLDISRDEVEEIEIGWR
ncbi:MAG: hypothetical protein R6V17_06310 [Halanaerobacter sp.]